MTSMKKKLRILCMLLIILFFSGMTQNPQMTDAKKITTSSRQKNPPANYSTRYMGWANCKPSYMTIYNGKYATMSYWDVKKTITVEYFNSKFKSTFSWFCTLHLCEQKTNLCKNCRAEEQPMR